MRLLVRACSCIVIIKADIPDCAPKEYRNHLCIPLVGLDLLAGLCSGAEAGSVLALDVSVPAGAAAIAS